METRKAEPEPRLIWQEVDDELDILTTCSEAVGAIEAEHWTGDECPITSTFQASLCRLKKVLSEIMETWNAPKHRGIKAIHPGRSEDGRTVA